MIIYIMMNALFYDLLFIIILFESLRIILLIYDKIYYLYMRIKNLRKSIQNIYIEAIYKI